MGGDSAPFKQLRQMNRRNQNGKQRPDQHETELLIADLKIDDPSHQG